MDDINGFSWYSKRMTGVAIFGPKTESKVEGRTRVSKAGMVCIRCEAEDMEPYIE